MARTIEPSEADRMHEWALAEAVVAKASEVADRQGIRTVTTITIGIGELQQIDREAFEFGLRQAADADPILAGATFEMETEPAELACRRCSRAWPLIESWAALSDDQREAIHVMPEAIHVYVACPACASLDFRIERGRGVSLSAVAGL